MEPVVFRYSISLRLYTVGDLFSAQTPPPGFSIGGVFLVRMLELVSISSPGDLPDPVMELASPAWQADSLPLTSREALKEDQGGLQKVKDEETESEEDVFSD